MTERLDAYLAAQDRAFEVAQQDPTRPALTPVAALFDRWLATAYQLPDLDAPDDDDAADQEIIQSERDARRDDEEPK